jgi:ribose/xylose/arabinose/galactoside ABC-type transport system permease subunit
MNIKSVTSKKIFQAREVPLIIVVAIVVAALTFLSPYFFTSGNFEILARQTGLALLIAVGMTFVILTAGIDLFFNNFKCQRASSGTGAF